MPKDIVYIIQEYARDVKPKNINRRELLQSFKANARDDIFNWWFFYDQAIDHILRNSKMYNILINNILNNKKWVDPYYYEDYSDDDNYSVCTFGNCTKNIHSKTSGSILCYDHNYIKVKVKRRFRKVLKQLKKRNKLINIVERGH